jgi:hypothetical protein
MGSSRSSRGSVFQYQTFEKPFNYQTFNWHKCQFTDHPIIPPGGIRFSNRFTDDEKSDANSQTERDAKGRGDDLGLEEPLILDDPFEIGMVV